MKRWICALCASGALLWACLGAPGCGGELTVSNPNHPEFNGTKGGVAPEVATDSLIPRKSPYVVNFDKPKPCPGTEDENGDADHSCS